MNIDDLDPFTRAYLECALWSSTNEDGDSEFIDGKYSLDDLSPKAVQQAKDDCGRFATDNGQSFFGAYMILWNGSHGDFEGRMGHCFWLSRNGHGSGYFDERPKNAVWDKLQNAARDFGETNLVVGDDGKLYFE
jgi:hypothetical protein